MKKMFDKKIIFGFVLGIIVMSGIGVIAQYLYQSQDVIYKKSDGTETNAKSALDELYDIYTSGGNIDNLSISNIIESSTGTTSATLSHTFTEDGIAGVGYHAGNTSYSLNLQKNGQVISTTDFWSFGLYKQMTKLVKVKKGDILSLAINGSTANKYDYYKVFMCNFNI